MSTLKFWNIYKYGDQNHFFLKFLKEEGSMENLSSQGRGELGLLYLERIQKSPLCIQSPGLWSVRIEVLEF